jgi:hypothetical protein
VPRPGAAVLLEIMLENSALCYSSAMTEKHVLERAFEIAKSGTCSRVHDLRQVLKLDGSARSEIEGHTQGASIKRQLLGLIEASRNSMDRPA